MRITHVPSGVQAVTDESFEQQVLKHERPVLVDFWAEWCAPCRMISSVLAEIAQERAGELTIRTINNDENPVTAGNYRVMSLPTLILFHAGEPVQSFIGARPKRRLLAELDDALGKWPRQ